MPASRFARATRLGGLTASLIGSMASGATGQLIQGKRPQARELLLTPANAHRLTRELIRMRGAAMKLGQLISMESAEMVPPELAEILAQLRAEAHHMPPAQLKQVLVRSYGANFLTRFQKFDARPFAAASIGQVHHAVTKDGRHLALKVQYPGIRGAIDADIANLGSLMRMSGLIPKGLNIKPLLEEARKQLHEEADYTRERQQLSRMAERLEGTPGLSLPNAHADFSNDDILAMDFMQGHPIEDLERAEQKTRDSVMHRLFTMFLHELMDWRHMQTDPNFANFLYDPDVDQIVLLDFGAARDFAPKSAAAFQSVLAATARDDPNAIKAALSDMGFIRAQTPAPQVNALLDMVTLLRQPLTQGGLYDFGDTRLLDQLREAGMHLGRDLGYLEIPDTDTLFVQRKLGGLVLLATRLRARVPLRDILAPYLTHP